MPQRFTPAEIGAFAQAVLVRLGLPDTDAATVSHTLVHADLIGVSTHGVARLPSYAERLRRGLVTPHPEMRIDERFAWSAAIDADNAMGAVAADRAVAVARRLLDRTGIAAVTVRNSNHFGTAGFYARALAGDDCIGFCVSPASKSLAPFGSQEPLLGTNPIALSVPAGRHPHWTMDMATSIAARGHIRLAVKEGRAIPEGWALDPDGRPTTDPALAVRGVMLPFAGPKGSALAMMVDILGGVLSGSAFAGGIRDMNFDFEAPQDVGHFFLAWKIEAFLPPAEFAARMETLIARLKALKPAAGVSEVMYPGEVEARAEAENRRRGIKVTDEIAAGLRDLGDPLGIPFPVPRTETH